MLIEQRFDFGLGQRFDLLELGHEEMFDLLELGHGQGLTYLDLDMSRGSTYLDCIFLNLQVSLLPASINTLPSASVT